MSQTLNTLEQVYATGFSVAVPTGGEAHKNITGKFLIVTDVTGGDGSNFEISLDGNSWFPLNLGLGFNLPGNASFSKIAFRNPQGSEITVQGYASNFQFVDSRLNIVRTRTPTLDVSVQNAPTYSKSFTDVLDDELVEFDGLDGTNKRKSITVSNLEKPTGDLAADYAKRVDVMGLNEVVGVPVYPGGSVSLETGGKIVVQVVTGSPIEISALETFYES